MLKSIEFGLPNLANACGCSPFNPSPFQKLGKKTVADLDLLHHLFRASQKSPPIGVHLQLNLNSLFMEVSLRPCEIRCLGSRGKESTDRLPKIVHFKWSWVRCLLLSHYFPRQSWRCKKWREVLHLRNWSFHFKKQWFVGCIPGRHRWKWRSLDPKRAKEEIHEEGICKSPTYRHHPFNIFQSKAIR